MRLHHTPEMEKLWKNIEPYIEKGRLDSQAPPQIKKNFEEYRRLSDEQFEHAYNL